MGYEDAWRDIFGYKGVFSWVVMVVASSPPQIVVWIQNLKMLQSYIKGFIIARQKRELLDYNNTIVGLFVLWLAGIL